jgi:hypothetical protein
MIVSRRGFLGMIAAPAVIRIADLMPVKTIIQCRGPIQFIGINPVSQRDYLEACIRMIATSTGVSMEMLSYTWPDGRLIPSEKAVALRALDIGEK